MDAIFSLEFEYKRFISRFPKLSVIPKFKSLLDKGVCLTEDEVVNVVSELFLHSDYTIPLLGCFRSIAPKIVERILCLLRLVPDLKSDTSNHLLDFERHQDVTGVANSDNMETFSLIDFHVRRGSGLVLHELACLAFCRALDLMPSLLGHILDYFKLAPPPFQWILLEQPVYKQQILGSTRLLDICRTSYRLLLAKPDVFATLWNWSCFEDLVQLSIREARKVQQYVEDAKEAPNHADVDVGKTTNLLNIIFDISWCGIQILSATLRTSNEDNALKSDENFACSLRWLEFYQDVSIEKAGWFIQLSNEKKQSLKNEVVDCNQIIHTQNFDPSPLDVMQTELNKSEFPNKERRLMSWNLSSCSNRVVMTSSVEKSFEMAMLAVGQKWPVLLYGPAGAGKTELIAELARRNGSQVLLIHMSEHIDGKTLVGSYVCAEQPGEFRWQPGSLAQAVMNGYWVVFEDIDKAPSDVQSVLLPLLEGACLFSTGHGEAIKVPQGFRLFSTISSSKPEIALTKEGGSSLSNLWRRVMIESPSNEDLMCILKVRYSNLGPLAAKLIETLENINHLMRLHTWNNASLGSFSRFTLRDLLKWCKRITELNYYFDGDALPADVCNSIYQEAVDIFASFSSSVENRRLMMETIARTWGIATLYPLNKPVIKEFHSDLCIGRITLQRTQTALHNVKPFVELRNSLHILERIACSVKFNESILLVGETGTGKTTLVQTLAQKLGRKLTVLNLSQQSDATDLLGGFKPVNARYICIPLFKEFESLFRTTFSLKDNEDFLDILRKMVTDGKWKKLLNGFRKAVDKFSLVKSGSSKKRKRSLRPEVEKAWSVFSLKLQVAYAQINDSSGMVFSFVEGAFVSALRTGEWILLDEVNLAPPETLQRIIGVLEDENGSFCLAERGDVEHIHRHPNFRLFACMNPATDAGKRDLPFSLRNKFTEYFFDDVVDDNDLILFINQFMDDEHAKNGELVKKIASFYKAARKMSEERLQDGANQKPQYSLRSLYRALEYVRKARRKFGFNRALYDGFCMFFLTLLDTPSAKSMNQMISSYLMDSISLPQISFENYVVVERNCASVGFVENYVLTETVRKHLKDLARAIFVGRYPVLLQGPTSSGKTSLVQYLAAITGHEFVRINNHEHTDLQEYLGSYITDSKGKLVFQEGVLVKAVRHGHWIVLDELNLAPSDVLEALNRLLDDNRELFVPELQETIRAHPDFMLFATQNPPTIYGGRKILSRAFRNRFVEIHVDEIPEKELSTILQNRYKVPEKYAKKMVEVMKELQLRRQGSKVFAGKHGFITPRDLFRWAIRFMRSGEFYEASGGTSFLSNEVLAQDGYFLLAERLRDEGEKKEIQEVLEKWFGAKLAVDDIYSQKHGGRDFKSESCSANPGNVVWTRSMWRLYFLIKRCYEMREPILLIGETGGGKTTVCQLLSSLLGSNLQILNCHRYSETSDFLGGFHPIRDRSKVALDFSELCEKLMQSKPLLYFPDDARIHTDIRQASSTLEKLDFILDSYKLGPVTHPEVTLYDLNLLEQLKQDLVDLQKKWLTIFMWEDGPLVQAMKHGDLFLVDEISLADDSVLERLNSVLEPERKLALAEKGSSDLEIVTAHENFLLLATMNPGGDYGKKELSPALRNRFTEIWVPHVGDIDELRDIALWRIHKKELSCIVEHMLNFWKWFNELQTGKVLTVRDLLSWVDFINSTEGILQPDVACLHGLFLVLLDGLSLGTGIVESEAGDLRERCFSFLSEQLKADNFSSLDPRLYSVENYECGDLGHKPSLDCMECDDLFGISPFYISKGNAPLDPEGFEFSAKTTRKNALRVLRALQLQKPVLLEGSPGVGKTSLIMALGKYSQHKVVRINLSEQTDLMDLLGSDLPVESDDGLQFAWSDGILLQALKNGYWVLLDELNLASQSVLEGLNAILDHRAEVFIPELGVTYKCPPSFRVFACQNPSYQGGGRKELPKSFLNRFAKVYVDQLAEEDYKFISCSLFPSISESLLDKIIHFNKRLCEDIMVYRKFGQGGSPWEFNLRDVVRLCQLIQGAPQRSRIDSFINTIYIKRMRKETDRKEILKLFFEIFGMKPSLNPYPRVQLTPGYLIVGDTPIERNHVQLSKSLSSELKLLPGIRHNLEAVSTCVQQGWLCILVGSPSSGKTSLIRLLSELTGNVLNELNLSSATDISELLGCFELQQEDSSGKTNSAKFEWVTGVLVKAVESGEWIILENANLCNPTVLDRINSLVESRGSITINECGTLDGKPKVIHPHPKFRMFLTVDPSYGEISRAMRNRGVEVYMMPPHWLLNDANNDNHHYDELNDVRQFLILSGVPFDSVVDSMAKSHLYTKDEGLCLNVSITYLELGRWVQLLKQLLAGGGQLVWSLQTSWEYTYISSLGKARGNDILSHVMHTFLSIPKLYVDSGSPCLPGGWPSPLQIRDLVQYSREACIRQNCMYLEYLGAQGACASSMHSSSHMKRKTQTNHIPSMGPYLMNMKMLEISMFPNSDCSHHGSQEDDGLILTKRRFMLAANWTIEQATEHDLQLYLHWFSWFALQLTQETGHFFISFLSSLQEELKHPIWKSIFKCRRKLLSHHNVDLESCPIPMLSLDLVDLSEDKISQSTVSNNMLESQNELLNSIRCISLLRVTFQQWKAEDECHINFQPWKIDSLFEYSNKDQCLKRFLLAVRKLEENLLIGLVQSPEFSSLVQIYAELIEEHVSFWTSITSGQSENLQMSWHSLLKKAGKLHYLFPDEVVALLMESKRLKGETSWGHYLQKSLLWVHGGHPLVASSSVMHTNQSQLLRLCELVWPNYAKKRNSATDESFITGAVSSIPGLRRLALEGISMSTYVMTNIEESDPVDQLEEMYQVLVKRLAHEKDQLKAVSDTSKCTMSLANLTFCCILSPKILCRKFGFDGWQDTLPIVEKAAFLFDLQLLKKLSDFVLFNGNEDCPLDPSTLSDQLESCLKFSLDFSSRPPITLAPHQKILWTLDVLATPNEGNTKVASFVLEMWFCWHSLIWSLQPAETKGLANINIEDMLLPDALFKPIRFSTANRILQSEPSVNDYPMYCWKLRLVSHYLWRSFLPSTDVQNNLYCAALSLFQQIIYAHEKSFCADDFVLIKSILCSSQKDLKTNDIKKLLSLLKSSSHPGLVSLLEPFVKPIVDELYLKHSSDSVYGLACAWLHLGVIRYHLLILCDDMDPTVKYSSKYQKLLEKVALLELDIKVREECVYLAGSFAQREAEERRTRLANLKDECRRFQRKVVYRSDPGKFLELKNLCSEFLKMIMPSFDLIKNVKSIDTQILMEQMRNWQATSTNFISRLSNDYAAYIDIIQPVQIAVYEMKLGLSLVLSSVMQEKYLEKIGMGNMSQVEESVYAFVRFPRGCALKTLSFDFDLVSEGMITSRHIVSPISVNELDVNFLEIMVASSSDVHSDNMQELILPLKADIYQNILVRAAHSITDSQLMDDESFAFLEKTFEKFASLWVDMKVQMKARESDENRQYIFKPRAFNIGKIMEIDRSIIDSPFGDDMSSEWKEMISEEELNAEDAPEEHDTLEDEWKFIEESLLNNLVNIHNQLFGSKDLLHTAGYFKVSEAERLTSFSSSYRLGAKMSTDMNGLIYANLDARLVPEQMLHLCLEHEQKFNISCSLDRPYSFYKDSNAPELAKIVEPVTSLQRSIMTLLNEWDNHYALQKIKDITEKILEFPLSTPLHKALSGLRFLYNTVRGVQDTVAKFPLSGELASIVQLASSWQKLEYEYWPAMFDEVEKQFDVNASKLWFPLYSVLKQKHSKDLIEHNRITIESLKAFMETSSVGEFRRRIQLLFAMHGYIKAGICKGLFSSSYYEENLKIMYNMFGFYVQHLPVVLEHLDLNKKTIQSELKKVLKLCKWDHPERSMSIDDSKRTKQKLRKLIQKYTDVLQKPIMLIINQGALKGGMAVQTSPKYPIPDLSKRAEEKFSWFMEWKKKASEKLQYLGSERSPDFEILNACLKNSALSECFSSNSSSIALKEENLGIWTTIDTILQTAVSCNELWIGEGKSLGKRRALSEFLKLLDSCGLLKHRSSLIKDQELDQSNWWLFQPSYDISHLLSTQDGLPSEEDVSAALSQALNLPSQNVVGLWEATNKYYFRSINSVKNLLSVSLNFHKDFTQEQVLRSCSFLNHLVVIQQEHRAAAYAFAEKLGHLKKWVLHFENLYSGSQSDGNFPFADKQHLTFTCMWQQKQVFDSLCSMTTEECLLLKMVENNHLATCESVKVTAHNTRLFIEEYLPVFQRSKDLLDTYLLGHNRMLPSSSASLHPYGVSKQMELLVLQNFRVVELFEKQVYEIDEHRASFKNALLLCYQDIFNKVHLISSEYSSNTKVTMLLDGEKDIASSDELEAAYDEALKETYKHMMDVFNCIDSWSTDQTAIDSFGNITLWKNLFASRVTNLKLDFLNETIMKLVCYSGKLLNRCAEGSRFHSIVGLHLKHVFLLLESLVNLGDSLLGNFQDIQRTVSLMTCLLANVFASLYTKGFGQPSESETTEAGDGNTQEAKGTGMGDGAGKNDVSDQITDEDQLLGASDQPDAQDASNQVPNDKPKGIEMEQDFEADTFSMNEESGDDNDEDDENTEEEQLDSAMDKTGSDNETIAEKLWDKNDDIEEKPDSKKEKYETGPSIRDTDSSNRELRAKDDNDSSPADNMDADDSNPDKTNDGDDDLDDDNENEDPLDGDETPDDMNIDKQDAFTDSSGLKIDEHDQVQEEDKMIDEEANTEPMEDANMEEIDEPDDNRVDEEDKAGSADEYEEGGDNEKGNKNLDTDEPAENNPDTDEPAENNPDESREMDLVSEKPYQPSYGNPSTNITSAESLSQPMADSCEAGATDSIAETQWSSGSETQNNFAPMRGPNPSDMEKTMTDPSDTGKMNDQPQSQSSQPDLPSQKMQSNPCRSIGDALKDWKERVRVSVDVQDNQIEDESNVMEEDNVNEYGYTQEFDKGTDQALGPATPEQTNNEISGEKPEGGDSKAGAEIDDKLAPVQVDKNNDKPQPPKNAASSLVSKINDVQMKLEGTSDVVPDHDASGGNRFDRSQSESLVSMKKSFLNDDIRQFTDLSLDDNDHHLGKANIVEHGMIDSEAVALWKKYETRTTRSAQELVEQLRMVMEPTRASKLQGDYKTGKRINMKKVIPYIASHYRKDKIWLRRTRPDKRNYQVVIAMDDSQSMSESHCGDVAIEALVTVCRAMSQLEVGDLSVASFGKEGNIQLLHEFDKPFTQEAGVKVISSLTFNQENTIADEPMVDLLRYLNTMLDSAVVSARLPSGQNPLQQLVLIIADGRFHEKEKLKRYVRDATSRKRMVAFLLVDSPEESIMDLEDASFVNGNVEFSKYLDSFPFPYYIVLKNIEALPRTLSDLLRQWFELMQYSSE